MPARPAFCNSSPKRPTLTPGCPNPFPHNTSAQTAAKRPDQPAALHGRQASVHRQIEEFPEGRICTFVVEEPISGGGVFRTEIQMGTTRTEVSLFLTLQAGGTQMVAPQPVSTCRPNLLPTILGRDLEWKSGGLKLTCSPLRFRGLRGAAALAIFLRDPDRALPFIVVSEQEGLTLHPEIENKLADELLGVAHVCRIDPNVSWELTKGLGRSYSCFFGAIRLYWPGFSTDSRPLDHPLWTAHRLLESVGSTEAAQQKLIRELKRRIFGVAAHALDEPVALSMLRARISHWNREQRLKEAERSQGWQEIAEGFADDLEHLEREFEKTREANKALKQRLYSFETGAISEGSAVELEPEEETPPQTVEEAVARARTRFECELFFGSDVEHGVESLNQSAGPPDKLFSYLTALAGLSAERSSGAIGTGMIAWLNKKNIAASAESDAVSTNKAMKRQRTWDDGYGRRYFSFHLKPSDGVSPDRCVRVYFDWDEERQMIVVGWVGRHP